MKSLKIVGLCIGLIAGLSLFGCSADSDGGKTATKVDTEQDTKAAIAKNPHIPPQARASVYQNMDRAKAGGLGSGNVTPK